MVHQFVSNTETALGPGRRPGRRAAWTASAASRPGDGRRPSRRRMTGPLDGLRVLDLGTRIAAPFCAGLLGEQGAEVIKIEQPGTGDFMREIGPFVDLHAGDGRLLAVLGGRGPRPQERDPRPAQARGHDLLRGWPPQRRAVRELPAGHPRALGPGPGDLDPRLVIVRISAFGQDGPYALRPGLDRLGIGYGGLLNLTGYPDRPPGAARRDHQRLPDRRVRRAGRAGRAVPPRRRRPAAHRHRAR